MKKQLVAFGMLLMTQLVAQPPNVVLIIGDDISPDFSCFGGQVQTPNIDGLAANGIRFDNAYVTASSCSPSRSSILTGRFPHNTGAPELHMGLPEGQFLFPQALKDAGYYCAQYGKWHVGDYPRQAFHEVQSIKYSEDPTGAKGWIPLLQNRPMERPFFMLFEAYDAHRPWEPDELETPHDPKNMILPAGIPDTPLARIDFAAYCDEVRRFDRNVGGVVNELKQQGVLDDTLIILLGDNGRPFPRSKTSLFDNGMKTPLVIHWPNGNLKAGSSSQSLVSTIDIAPAILEAANLPIPSSIQGISLLPVCRDPSHNTRERLFGERNWHTQIGCGRLVREGNWVYMRDFTPNHYSFMIAGIKYGAYAELLRLKSEGELTAEQAELFSTNRPPERLYHVLNDPQQIKNLADDPAYEEQLKHLRKTLKDWQLLTGDSIPAVDEMMPDRYNRDTFERIHPGWRPPTGIVPSQQADAKTLVTGPVK